MSNILPPYTVSLEKDSVTVEVSKVTGASLVSVSNDSYLGEATVFHSDKVVWSHAELRAIEKLLQTLANKLYEELLAPIPLYNVEQRAKAFSTLSVKLFHQGTQELMNIGSDTQLNILDALDSVAEKLSKMSPEKIVVIPEKIAVYISETTYERFSSFADAFAPTGLIAASEYAHNSNLNISRNNLIELGVRSFINSDKGTVEVDTDLLLEIPEGADNDIGAAFCINSLVENAPVTKDFDYTLNILLFSKLSEEPTKLSYDLIESENTYNWVAQSETTTPVIHYAVTDNSIQGHIIFSNIAERGNYIDDHIEGIIVTLNAYAKESDHSLEATQFCEIFYEEPVEEKNETILTPSVDDPLASYDNEEESNQESSLVPSATVES